MCESIFAHVMKLRHLEALDLVISYGSDHRKQKAFREKLTAFQATGRFKSMRERQIPSSCRKTARVAVPIVADPPVCASQRCCSKSVSTGNFQDLQVVPPTVKSSLTFSSLLKSNPRAVEYVFVRKYEKAPEDVVAVRRAAIEQATTATIHRLNVLIEKMNERMKELTDKRRLIIHHIQGFDVGSKSRSAHMIRKRLCAKILLELRLEYLELYILHESELCADVELVRQLVKLFHDEQPENEIRVNFRVIEAARAAFPGDAASKMAFERQDRFNTYFERLGETKEVASGARQLGEIVKSVQYNTEFRFVYFREIGTAQSDFERVLKSLPVDVLDLIEASVGECHKNQRDCGKIILMKSVELSRYFGLSDSVVRSIVFLFLLRYVFSRIYVEHPVKLPPLYNEFVEKIDFLRRQPPTEFGDARLFIPDELIGTPLVSFPVVHKYQPAIESLELIMFDYNPLDFCTHINETVMMVHEIAAHVEAQKTGDKGSSHGLNNDQLIDVFLVVCLLAHPEQIRNLVCHFDVYVTGLGIPQQLEFSLTTVKAVIHTIMSTNITDVCKV